MKERIICIKRALLIDAFMKSIKKSLDQIKCRARRCELLKLSAIIQQIASGLAMMN